MESKPLWGLTTIEFKELIRGIIREELAALKLGTNENTLLNVHEAAALLNVAVTTLYGKTSERLIPHYKHGKKLMFKKSELLAWVSTRKIKTVTEIKQEAMRRTTDSNPKSKR